MSGSRAAGRAVLLLTMIAALAVTVSAQPISLEDDRIVMNDGNITTLDWLNADGQEIRAGGNINLGELNITNCAFINGTKCENLGGGSVSDTYVDEAGDTMSGELNMSWNNITDVGNGGITLADGDGDLDMEGNRLED
ncbi:MAG: hypothetical protein ABEI97_00650, partial [Candidatus Nanohaloarchaea archaeon]